MGFTELSTASTASVAGVNPPAHAEIVPSSVAKMNAAAIFVPGTRKELEGFQTIPVGAAGVVAGGLLKLKGWHELGAMMPPGSGMDTCRPTLVPSPA